MVQGVGSMNTLQNGNIYIFLSSPELKFISFTSLWMWKCRKKTVALKMGREIIAEKKLSPSRISLKWFNRWVTSSITGLLIVQCLLCVHPFFSLVCIWASSWEFPNWPCFRLFTTAQFTVILKIVAFSVHVVILWWMHISFNGYAMCFFHLWGFPWLLSSYSESTKWCN